MDIVQLRGFLAVAREKSFSKAAKRLFKTQSTVSIQIKGLENELGVQLFDRISPKKTELTKEGVLFLQLASGIVSNVDSLIERFNQKRGIQKGGEIKIATHEPVIAYVLPDTIKHFQKKYPEIRISLFRKERDSVLTSVLNGEVDLGISYLKHIPPSLNYQIIGRQDRVLVVPREHPLAVKKNLFIEDISKWPLILPPTDSSTRRIIDEVFKAKGLQYELVLEVSGRESTKKYIELGFGISIFNESLLSREDKKRFSIKSVAHLFGQSERAVITRKNRKFPKYVEDFIGIMRLRHDVVDV